MTRFNGVETPAVKSVSLRAIFSEPSRRVVLKVEYIEMAIKLPWNVILDAIVSTLHHAIKFPTKNGVGRILSNQNTLRSYYLTSLKMENTKVVTIKHWGLFALILQGKLSIIKLWFYKISPLTSDLLSLMTLIPFSYKVLIMRPKSSQLSESPYTLNLCFFSK